MENKTDKNAEILTDDQSDQSSDEDEEISEVEESGDEDNQEIENESGEEDEEAEENEEENVISVGEAALWGKVDYVYPSTLCTVRLYIHSAGTGWWLCYIRVCVLPRLVVFI